MKKFILSIILTVILIASSASAEFFRDVIVTSPHGIWTDSRAYINLNAAITAVGVNERTIKIVSPQVVTALTVPSNVTLSFERNGSITNSGQLTINSRNIIAKDRQIFTGVGDIDFAAGSVVRSSWFSDVAEAIDVTNDDELTLTISKASFVTSSCTVGDNVNLKWESARNQLTANGGVVISNIKNIEAGNYQLFAGAGDFDFLDGTELKLNWFARLSSVLTWVEDEEVTIIVNEDSLVQASVASTSNENIKVVPGGVLNLDAGVVLTINGSLDAGLYQVFSGAGSVVYNGRGLWFTDWVGTSSVILTVSDEGLAIGAGGSISVPGVDTGYQFKDDAWGVYQFTSMVNGVTHFSDVAVDGIKFEAGGEIWGYLIDVQKSTGHVVPQLYFKDFPFKQYNFWGAPILFDLHTTDGNNRSIAINMSDSSTIGTLSTTGIEINIDTPPDRGGDTSGLYIRQAGGGNAMSVYKLSSSFPNNGFALEAAANGGSPSIYTKAENGETLLSEISGSVGIGMRVFPSTDTDLNRRAYKVSNADNSVEKFYVRLDGYTYIADDIQVSGKIGVSVANPLNKLHIYDADSTIRFTTPVTGSTVGDGLLIGYQDEAYNKALIWNIENTDLEIATNNTLQMVIEAGGDVKVSNNFHATGNITATGNCCVDYVFEDDYDLITLNQLQNFIEDNNHLPGITIGENNQVDLIGVTRQFLEKTEEQALYILQLHKRLRIVEITQLVICFVILPCMIFLMLYNFKKEQLIKTLKKSKK